MFDGGGGAFRAEVVCLVLRCPKRSPVMVGRILSGK